MEKKHKLKNVAIRMVKAPPLYSDEQIISPKDVVRVLGKELADYDREVLCVVNFRGDGRPINMNIVSMGTVNSIITEARESLQSEYDSIGKEQTKTATELAYAEVIRYNKKNLERELQNESRQHNRRPNKTKRGEKEL